MGYPTERFPRPTALWSFIWTGNKRRLAFVMIVLHISGALTSIQAVMETRTSQGAIAWAVSLNTFPFAALPAYWIFGRTKFQGYVKKRQVSLNQADPIVRRLINSLRRNQLLETGFEEKTGLVERLAKLPATTGNDVKLLRNGKNFFPSIFDGIDKAQEYILVQFYMVRDDRLGKEFQERLVAAAQRNVRVRFLYDEIGCYRLPGSYLDTLRRAGVELNAFNSILGPANRFQINFRNHRKIVVVDGRQAWIGGANVGNEYLDQHSRLTPWIDTMIKVTGPAVQLIQVPFLEDWFWASGELIELEWTPRVASSGASQTVMILPTGPADRFETCALYFLNAIHCARQRLWITTPYFVPDEQIVSALQLAGLRGIDVRIIVPEDSDHFLTDLSSWSYVASLEKAGVKIYRHTNGFIHHKAMLIDSDISTISTANFDNRSFRLNFEITAEIRDADFAREVEAMFLENFSGSRLASAQELEDRSFFFRLAVRVARLLAPIQ